MGPWIWGYGTLYMDPWQGYTRRLGPGNTHPSRTPVYPGYTHPSRAVHRGAALPRYEALLNAYAILSKLRLVDHRFTIRQS